MNKMTFNIFLLVAVFIVGISGWQVTIVNNVASCPARTYAGTITLFVNGGQRDMNKGKLYYHYYNLSISIYHI